MMNERTTDTLQEPCELWSNDEGPMRVYSFIRRETENSPRWHVVIACDSAHDELEILDEFVTEDERLVDAARRGRCELRRSVQRTGEGEPPLC